MRILRHSGKNLGSTILVAVLALSVLFALAEKVRAQASDEGDLATPAVQETNESHQYAFVIRPSDGLDGDFFTIESSPGETSSLSVVLGNADTIALDLTTYVADIVPKNNGGFGLADRTVEPAGVATWINYPTERLEFGPSEGIERRFTVTVPEDASPGQYIAGISLETTDPLPIPGTTQHTQVIRKSIAVFIVVPGPSEPSFELGILDFADDDGGLTISVPVSNTGNVLVKPKGELTLTNAKGEVVFTLPIEMGSVYADTTSLLVQRLGESIPDGDYQVALTLVDEATGVSASLPHASVSVTREARANAQFLLDGTVTMLPDTSSPIYAEAELTVTNRGEAVTSTEVLVDVIRNGEVVETFPLATSLALPQGETIVTQRYIPPAGFESGTWEFVVRLNVVDPNSGAATTVAVLDTIDSVLVP